MSLRDILWQYPWWVLGIYHRFERFFLIIFGVLVGVLAYLLLSWQVQSRITRTMFDGQLRYGFVSTYDTPNPLRVGATDAEIFVGKLLFNGLIFADESGNIFPELAETWSISPDGREYTFYLKRGVQWHDSVEFTAKDVATTFALLQSGASETVLGEIANDVEVGVRGLYEVTFTLKQVNAAFLELLATPILPDHIYGGITFSRALELGDSLPLVGTGPYRFVRKEGSVLLFNANRQYFKGAPEIRTIQVSTFPSYKLARTAFLSGKVHTITPISTTELDELEQMSNVSKRILIQQSVQSNNTRVLLFNVQEGKIGKNEYIRHAIAKAVNREYIMSLVPGSQEAYGPYGTNSYVYSSTVEAIHRHSVSEAGALLEKEGWKYPYSGAPYRVKSDSELQVTMTFLDSEISREIALEIRKQLARVGINVILKGIESESLLQNVLPQKEFELLFLEIHTGLDPDQYGLWHSTQSTFPGLNLSGQMSPKIDELLEKGRLQTNRLGRIEIYKQFQEVLVRDAVAVFLYHPSYFEASFDIIDRRLPQSISEPRDRYTDIHLWKLLPGWRNWQTR